MFKSYGNHQRATSKPPEPLEGEREPLESHYHPKDTGKPPQSLEVGTWMSLGQGAWGGTAETMRMWKFVA